MKITGGPELLALLEQLPAKIGRSVVRGGVRAAAGVVRDEARSTVRRKSGALAKSLKLSTDTRGTIVSAKVKARGKHAFLAKFIEYGVGRHIIVSDDAEFGARQLNARQRARGGEIKASPNNPGLLKFGGRWVSGAVDHPGHAAFPFMRPALDTKAAEAINVMGEYIRARLSWGALSAPSLAVEPDEE